jgi:anthranilate phosphoribosyltransferase
VSAYERSAARLFAGETLAEEEAELLMGEIIDGALDPLRVAAVLGALAARRESVEELVGFAAALQRRARGLVAPPGAMDTCGTGGSGQAKLNVSTAAAFVLAALGVPVAKHGNRSARGGLGSADLLEAHGVPLALPPTESARLLEATGFAFLFAPHHHPALRALAPIRRTLGARTTFNVLGPLVNPARVRAQLVGVSDAARAPVMARALARLGVERALVVASDGGLDELRPDRGATLCELRSGEVTSRRVEAVAEAAPELEAALPKDEASRLFLDVLAGQTSEPLLAFVARNAGAALHVAGRARSIAEGEAQARAALARGTPREAFERHREAARLASSSESMTP